ncbi:helix-turn-helix domain-containing protein [Sedimentimonas flavescens]|uniref:Helix-turn-helix domain-containing protein n=1 Tax=Sedimentimonas flavescens TaxID=2851012 RepID=A0ABT2ZYR8_9RHOB|nr:helix-turn-helix transcriptional regulator [Sedimentimonas flavescens]MBW0157688.1 helix-turn-helix domain-containing protein [Sedimentimonas flavescens]MCT2540841.1 helix-turn-helix domain-containing protein [Sedimentimonas flavescens]MCV2878803.1 helix-turn-helix domain-containing protein [Sedimentimonas flavescens]WBL31989.1 helix-turn-helix transcriptional regulator [Sinirhodobacter sp. HNIBRBA609]
MSDDWYGAEHATFGDRLTGAREAAGMSVEQLAERLGVRQETLQSWEDDAADPRANRLQMLAGMLNVSLMWLLTGKGDGLDGPPEAVAQAGQDRALVREIRAIRDVIEELDARLGRLERKLVAGELE